jgi:hypothetical protein
MTPTGLGAPPRSGWAKLVPELLVSDIGASIEFWCDRLGFAIAYQRPGTTEPAKTAEALRLDESRERGAPWRQWGQRVIPGQRGRRACRSKAEDHSGKRARRCAARYTLGSRRTWGARSVNRTRAGGDLRRDRRLLRRLRIFGQRDKSKADRSRKSVKGGCKRESDSAAFKERCLYGAFGGENLAWGAGGPLSPQR